MKVAIAGAGIGGLSLAWALRKRGVEVALFDQGPIPNPVSSSFDEHRITRHTYLSPTGYEALMPAAFGIYEALWKDFGRSHYLPTGIVYLVRGSVDRYDAAAAGLDGFGISHRRVGVDEIARRFPVMSVEGVTSAFEAGGAGMLFAQRIVGDLARWLAENGAELHPNTRIDSIDTANAALVAGGSRHEADIVVSAAGAWVSDLLPEQAGRLVPSRQLVLYLEPPADLSRDWAGMPVISDVGASYTAYVLPPREGTRLKIGDHHFTRVGHGSDDRIATEDDLAPVLAAGRTILRDFDRYRVLEQKVCYYTVTEDERFVMEPMGQAGWLLGACSGHGFKLGPLMGEILARAITGEIAPEEAKVLAAGWRAPSFFQQAGG